MNWTPEMEVSNYPPEVGPLSVYTIEEFFNTIDYAVNGFSKLNRAIGPYSYATGIFLFNSLSRKMELIWLFYSSQMTIQWAQLKFAYHNIAKEPSLDSMRATVLIQESMLCVN